MYLALRLTGAMAVLLLAGCLYDRAPAHRRVEMAFFMCGQCRSLEGGAYGRTPVKRFRGHKAAKCAHTWRRVTQSEFESLATRWYGFNWSAETTYWTGEDPGMGETVPTPPGGRVYD